MPGTPCRGCLRELYSHSTASSTMRDAWLGRREESGCRTNMRDDGKREVYGIDSCGNHGAADRPLRRPLGRRK